MMETGKAMVTRTQACLRHAEQQHREALERLAHTVALAQSGLHASVLINGGALIGLFSLIAPRSDLAAELWPAGLAFSAALALTIAGWLAATLSQDRFQLASAFDAFNAEAMAMGGQPKRNTRAAMTAGTRAIKAAYASVSLSAGAFVTGSLLTLAALS